MKQFIAHIALVVKEYDEAIAFYTQKLNFILAEDTVLSETKRWVLLAPPGNGQCKLLLARAATPDQVLAVGNQTGGRVFLFLFTDDFNRDYESMLRNGIQFVKPPSNEKYGTLAVFQDLYGTLWDLIEPASNNIE